MTPIFNQNEYYFSILCNINTYVISENESKSYEIEQDLSIVYIDQIHVGIAVL